MGLARGPQGWRSRLLAGPDPGVLARAARRGQRRGCSVGHQAAPCCWAQSRGGKMPKAPVPKVPGSTVLGPAGHQGLPQLPTAPALHPDLGAGAREHQGLCSASLPVTWVGPHGRLPAAPQPPALGPQPGWQAQHGPAGSGRPHAPTARRATAVCVHLSVRVASGMCLARLACVSPRGGPGAESFPTRRSPAASCPPSPLPHQRHTQEMRGSQARSRAGSSAGAAILIYVCGFV